MRLWTAHKLECPLGKIWEGLLNIPHINSRKLIILFTDFLCFWYRFPFFGKIRSRSRFFYGWVLSLWVFVHFRFLRLEKAKSSLLPFASSASLRDWLIIIKKLTCTITAPIAPALGINLSAVAFTL